MKQLLKYFKSRKKSLAFLLRYSKRKYSKKAFHRFRVEVKRLNALLQILQWINKNSKSRSFKKPLQRLFKRAGDIRELQIEKKLLTDHSVISQVPNLKNRLDKEIQKRRNDFFKSRTYSRAKKIKRKFKQIQRELEKDSKLDFTPFLEDQWEEILQLISTGVNSENTHLLRKKLKTYQYSLEILGKNNFPIHLLNIEELNKLLGDWHDLAVFLKRFDTGDLYTKANPSEQENFNRFVDQITVESEEKFQAIQTKLAKIQ